MFTPTIKRRFLISLPVILTACAVNDAGWETKPSHAPLPAYFVDATAAEIAQRCPRNYTVSGCAVRRYDIGKCLIYVEPSVPHWLSKHELEHCAGFSHP